MEDQKLINRIQSLKEIKPAKQWGSSLRLRLVRYAGDNTQVRESRFASILSAIAAGFYALERPAVVLPVLTLLVGGSIAWHQSRNSLPGDALYTLKSATERIQLSLGGEEERVLYHIALAQRRLDDLKRAAEENRVKNLSPAIFAFEESVGEASRELARLTEEERTSGALQAGRGLVQLQNGKNQVEALLGTKIGEWEGGELERAMESLARAELEGLRIRTLTEEQKTELEQAEDAFGEKRYAHALELIWGLQNGAE